MKNLLLRVNSIPKIRTPAKKPTPPPVTADQVQIPNLARPLTSTVHTDPL